MLLTCGFDAEYEISHGCVVYTPVVCPVFSYDHTQSFKHCILARYIYDACHGVGHVRQTYEFLAEPPGNFYHIHRLPYLDVMRLRSKSCTYVHLMFRSYI